MMNLTKGMSEVVGSTLTVDGNMRELFDTLREALVLSLAAECILKALANVSGSVIFYEDFRIMQAVKDPLEKMVIVCMNTLNVLRDEKHKETFGESFQARAETLHQRMQNYIEKGDPFSDLGNITSKWVM
jgi:hypothetical protein